MYNFIFNFILITLLPGRVIEPLSVYCPQRLAQRHTTKDLRRDNHSTLWTGRMCSQSHISACPDALENLLYKSHQKYYLSEYRGGTYDLRGAAIALVAEILIIAARSCAVQGPTLLHPVISPAIPTPIFIGHHFQPSLQPPTVHRTSQSCRMALPSRPHPQ